MIEVMPEDEMRRWLRQFIKPRDETPWAVRHQEFGTAAFCRAIGVGNSEFYNWLAGAKDMAPKHLRTMSRLIRAYENGMIEFQHVTKSKKEVAYRQTPRHMPPGMRFELGNGFPKLTVLPRGAAKHQIDRIKK